MTITRTVDIVEMLISVYLFIAQPAKERLTMATYHFVTTFSFANERMALRATFSIILNKVTCTIILGIIQFYCNLINLLINFHIIEFCIFYIRTCRYSVVRYFSIDCTCRLPYFFSNIFFSLLLLFL